MPEFFTKQGSFDLEKFKIELKENNINELSEGYQLNFIGKDYARRQAGEMPSTVIMPDEVQNIEQLTLPIQGLFLMNTP